MAATVQWRPGNGGAAVATQPPASSRADRSFALIAHSCRVEPFLDAGGVPADRAAAAAALPQPTHLHVRRMAVAQRIHLPLQVSGLDALVHANEMRALFESAGPVTQVGGRRCCGFYLLRACLPSMPCSATMQPAWEHLALCATALKMSHTRRVPPQVVTLSPSAAGGEAAVLIW